MQRIRVEKMERQLENLAGLVQQVLHPTESRSPPAVTPRQDNTYPRNGPGKKIKNSKKGRGIFNRDHAEFTSACDHRG